ncbi:TetR family transcriptional regulator [Microbacterium lacus]|uniref:TetR family transcriptional regulator n=1 Tax=Microbacterium lacus TaxID=415217 RepID=A0ABN2GJ60_9MICO
MPSTRDRALAAAVRLVGEQGVRALTHARVDAAAALPRGSTSNWFRTRDALVAGVVAWIADQERGDLTEGLARVSTVDDLVDAIATLLEDATGRHAARTRARYALFLETTATPNRQPSLRVERSRFETQVRDIMLSLRATDPELATTTLFAVSAGLIVNRLTIAPDAPIRPAIELVIGAMFPGQ